MMNELFYELIRVSIGTQDALSRVPTEQEWDDMYKMAHKQSLTGICFVGLQRLGADAISGFTTIGMTEMQYLKWMGRAVKIRHRNQVVNRQCVELQAKLSADGLDSSILKGQGAASLYEEQLRYYRQSGDIDVWIRGGSRYVLEYVQRIAPTDNIRDNHAALNIFEDTEVEAHFRPAILRNPIRNRCLQSFFEQHEYICCNNPIVLPEGKIHVPTAQFNVVYQMVHVFEHFYTEGVGLRQVMDYYFVLLDAYEKDCIELTEALNVLKRLGLHRFASALMWVMGYVFEPKALDYKTSKHSWMICPPSESDGKFLLREIMLSGNFGKLDTRQKDLYKSKWHSFWTIESKTVRFWRFDHSACFWSPLWRVHSYLVRICNGYK